MLDDEDKIANGSSSPERAARGGAIIALVDDDRNILTTVSIALQAEGYTTRVYSDGEAALQSLLHNPPDLAVFDIKMPRMDGMELLRRLREASDLPVIFLTSKDAEQDEEAGFEMGADDYIAKPFSLRLLLARVRAILKRTEARSKAPPDQDHPTALPRLDMIERGNLHMDAARHLVRWKGRQVFAHRHRVPDFGGFGGAARRHQVAQSIDGCRLSR